MPEVMAGHQPDAMGRGFSSHDVQQKDRSCPKIYFYPRRSTYLDIVFLITALHCFDLLVPKGYTLYCCEKYLNLITAQGVG